LSYLAPFRRYGGLLVENRQFVPTPPSFNALAQDDPLRILGWTWHPQKLEQWGYHMVKKSWSSVEPCGHSPRVWQTDGRTDRITITKTVQRIALHGKKQMELNVYSVSRPPRSILAFFPKRLEIFSPNFTYLLHVPIYAGLQILYPIICNFDEVMPY